MAGMLHLSAQNINNAGTTTAEQTRPTGHMPSPTELFYNVFSSDMGGLGHLFGHTADHIVSTPIEIVGDSVQTTLGGFTKTTRINGPAMAHPTDGDPTIGTDLTTAIPRFTDTVRYELTRLRDRLGI